MKPTTNVPMSLIRACLPATLIALAPGATAYEDTATITIEPVWVDGKEFGWGCDSELHEPETCSTVEGPGLRVGEAGEEAFGKRFAWRAEIKDKESEYEVGKGVCKLYLQPREPAGLPEKDVITLSIKDIHGVADSRCEWKFSPDGTAIGLAGGWADLDYSFYYKAKVYALDQLESRYWNMVGLDHYKTDKDKALGYFEWARATDPNNHWPFYNSACACALAGDTQNALVYLAAAIALDEKKLPKKAKKDKDLKSLRKIDDFKVLTKSRVGWEDVQARLGKPPAPALPPGLAQPGAAAAAEEKPAGDAPPPPPEVAPAPEKIAEEAGKEIAEGLVKGLRSKIGCSIGMVH